MRIEPGYLFLCITVIYQFSNQLLCTLPVGRLLIFVTLALIPETGIYWMFDKNYMTDEGY